MQVFVLLTSFNANNDSLKFCNASTVCSESMWSNNVCSNAVYVAMFFIVSVFEASEAKAATRMHTPPLLSRAELVPTRL